MNFEIQSNERKNSSKGCSLDVGLELLTKRTRQILDDVMVINIMQGVLVMSVSNHFAVLHLAASLAPAQKLFNVTSQYV